METIRKKIISASRRIRSRRARKCVSRFLPIYASKNDATDQHVPDALYIRLLDQCSSNAFVYCNIPIRAETETDIISGRRGRREGERIATKNCKEK